MKEIYLKDLQPGQRFYLSPCDKSLCLLFRGWNKEKHWYEYEVLNYGCYHFDVSHRSQLDMLHFKIVYIYDVQLTLF